MPTAVVALMMRVPILLAGLLLTAVFAGGAAAVWAPTEAGGADDADGAADAAAATVTVSNFRFRDTASGTVVSTVASGESVTWVWTEGLHTATQGVHNLIDGGPPSFDSGIKRPSDADNTFTVTFTSPGVHPYECTLHEEMRGVVVVVV